MATVAPPPPRPIPPTPAAAPAAEEPWVIAGVAAVLARRLRASAPFIRVVLVIISWVWAWEFLAVYAVAALLVPHAGRRRPGWSNLLGLARIGIFVFVIWLLGNPTPISTLSTGLFDEGPAAWLAFGGALLAGIIVLFGSGRAAAEYDEDHCRRIVLAALPAVAFAVAIGVGIVIAPGVRWELVLELGLIALAASLVLTRWPAGRNARMVPAVLLAVVAILLASSGARLQGGVGDTYARPASLASLHHAYRRAIGDETLDLRGLRDGTGRVVSVVASVGYGNLTIVVPTDATGSVQVRIGLGGLSTGLGQPSDRSGFDIRQVVRLVPQPYRPASMRSRLDLRVQADVGRGCVVIEQPGSSGGC